MKSVRSVCVVAAVLLALGVAADPAPARPAAPAKFSNARLTQALLTSDEVKRVTGYQGELPAEQDYCYSNGCGRGWQVPEGLEGFSTEIRQLRTAKLAKAFFDQVTTHPNGYGKPTFQSRSSSRAVFTSASPESAVGQAVQRRGKLVRWISCFTPADRVAEAARCAAQLLSAQDAKALSDLGS